MFVCPGSGICDESHLWAKFMWIQLTLGVLYVLYVFWRTVIVCYNGMTYCFLYCWFLCLTTTDCSIMFGGQWGCAMFREHNLQPLAMSCSAACAFLSSLSPTTDQWTGRMYLNHSLALHFKTISDSFQSFLSNRHPAYCHSLHRVKLSWNSISGRFPSPYMDTVHRLRFQDFI
jgi:hypothetical protein